MSAETPKPWREWNRQNARARMAYDADKRTEAGTCWYCLNPLPAPRRRVCDDCRVSNSESCRRYNAKKASQ